LILERVGKHVILEGTISEAVSSAFSYVNTILVKANVLEDKESEISNILQTIQEMSLPFLRKAAILLAGCLESAPNTFTFDGTLPPTGISDEFQQLCVLLQLPQIDMLLTPRDANSVFTILVNMHILDNWFVKLFTREAINLPLILKDAIEYSFKPFKLLDLPSIYQELFHKYFYANCANCKTNPAGLTICLLCGAVLCFNEKCCFEEPFGEVFKHSITCGAGSGLFLLIKLSVVVLIKEKRSAFWGSPYLDQHEEEDISLKRGKPLYLNKSFYQKLELALIDHKLDQEIFRPNVPGYKKCKGPKPTTNY